MQENKRENSIIKERILRYLDFKGISKYDCYQKTGISRSVLSQSNGMTEDNLLKFLAYYIDVNLEWLLTGKGEMLKSGPEATPISNVAENKPVSASVPESDGATALYSMLIERNENLARESGELKAENKQLKTEVEQLKAENGQLKAENEQLKAGSEELKKHEPHPYDTAYDLSTTSMIAAEPEIEYKRL
jgi:FtsZ-binding cell division protein ZapB